jgi:DNA polymerase
MPARARGSVLMLVGEQPGDQEDRQGRPFVGPAGRVLDSALQDAGLDRAATDLTKAVKHLKWTPAPRGKRRIHSKPTASEVRACRPWLETEIALTKPRVIVCLGATAGQSLLGASFRVKAQPGRALRGVNFGGWQPIVVATVHPSSILRLPSGSDRQAELDRLVVDLRLAKTLHESGGDPSV